MGFVDLMQVGLFCFDRYLGSFDDGIWDLGAGVWIYIPWKELHESLERHFGNFMMLKSRWIPT